MMKLEIELNGTYETENGHRVHITEELKEGDPDFSLDAMKHEQGYRFRSSEGNTYTIEGRYDVTQETALDLVRVVPKEYLCVVNKSDTSLAFYPFSTWFGESPEDLLRMLKSHHGIEDGDIRALYELKDVTPDRFRKNLEITDDDDS